MAERRSMRSNDPPKPVATVQPKVTGTKAAMAAGLKKPPGPVVSPVKETTQNTSMEIVSAILTPPTTTESGEVDPFSSSGDEKDPVLPILPTALPEAQPKKRKGRKQKRQNSPVSPAQEAPVVPRKVLVQTETSRALHLEQLELQSVIRQEIKAENKKKKAKKHRDEDYDCTDDAQCMQDDDDDDDEEDEEKGKRKTSSASSSSKKKAKIINLTDENDEEDEEDEEIDGDAGSNRDLWGSAQLVCRGPKKLSLGSGEGQIALLLRRLAKHHGIPIGPTRDKVVKKSNKETQPLNDDSNTKIRNEVKIYDKASSLSQLKQKLKFLLHTCPRIFNVEPTIDDNALLEICADIPMEDYLTSNRVIRARIKNYLALGTISGSSKHNGCHFLKFQPLSSGFCFGGDFLLTWPVHKEHIDMLKRMIRRPRRALLNLTTDWDMNNVTPEMVTTLLKTPFIYMVFVCEACGYWDGESDFHQAVTVSDEVHVLMTMMSYLLGWTTKAESYVETLHGKLFPNNKAADIVELVDIRRSFVYELNLSLVGSKVPLKALGLKTITKQVTKDRSLILAEDQRSTWFDRGFDLCSYTPTLKCTIKAAIKRRDPPLGPDYQSVEEQEYAGKYYKIERLITIAVNALARPAAATEAEDDDEDEDEPFQDEEAALEAPSKGGGRMDESEEVDEDDDDEDS